MGDTRDLNEHGRETTRWSVTKEQSGKTVLSVLREMCPGESWSQLRSRLQKARVSLNDLVCIDEARRVAEGDVIAIGEKPLTPPPLADAVRIHFADAHVIVVEKPSGMMTHRRPEEWNWSAARKAQQPSLQEAVIELMVRQAKRKKLPPPRGNFVRCVHRLDRDTSGLIVFARNDEAEKSLVDQFRRHEVHRVYWAIVHGHPRDETIVTHIARDRGDGRRGSSGNSKIGQRAVTHVRWLEPLGDYSLVECRLETGRTNQIRIHLSEKGHLVCGDVKYRQPFAAEAIEDNSGAPRLALHAAELGFVHPATNSEVFFTMPLPPDLEQLVERLKRRKGRSQR